MSPSVLLFTNASHLCPDLNEPRKFTKTLFEPEKTPPLIGTVGAGHAAKLPTSRPWVTAKGLPLTTR